MHLKVYQIKTQAIIRVFGTILLFIAKLKALFFSIQAKLHQ